MRITARDLWAQRVEATPERDFLGWAGQTWSFGETDAIVRRLAGGLAELGVARGTRVLLGVSNRVEMVWLQLALHVLGAVNVPLLGSLTFDELSYQVEHSEATLLVVDEPVRSTLLPRRAELPGVRDVVTLDGLAGGVAFADLLEHAPVAWPELPGFGPLDLNAILYTSGSTGRPKGVMLPTACVGTVGEAFSAKFGWTSEDNFVLPVTLAHALGAVSAVGMACVNGARLTVLDRFSPSRWWDQVAAAGGTTSILFPAHLNLLLELEAGAPASGETGMRTIVTHAWNDRFKERFGIELATVWGMTETGALCVGSYAGERLEVEGSTVENYVGTPMLGVEVQVVDDAFQPVPTGDFGEICLRHEHVMLGYLKNAEATEATLVDGWIRSGDLGYLDTEERLFFAGRLKNVIKRSGENVSAEEVESALATVEGIAESLVFAVPDRLRAEEVGAILVAREGAELDPPAVVAAVAPVLARWKLPRYVAVTREPLPRLGNGKVDRMRAKALLDPAICWDRDSQDSERA